MDERTYKEIMNDFNRTKGYVLGGGQVLRCSTRLKYYGDELAEIMICNRAVFSPNPPSEKLGKGRRKLEIEQDEEQHEDDRLPCSDLERTKRRARKKVFDYTMCNPDLDVFVTFTLSPDKIDRYDYKTAIKKLNTWLDNRVRRNGLKYVFVCERHKDGAIHFHGIVNRGAVKLIDSGKADKLGHKIYNVADWTLGFTTAIETYGSHTNVCKYITKYITKTGEKVGGRWYYSSNNLNEPRYEYMGFTTNEDFKGLDGFEVYKKEIKEINTEYTIISKIWK